MPPGIQKKTILGISFIPALTQETFMSKMDSIASNLYTAEMFKQNIGMIHLSLGMLEPLDLNMLKCAKPLSRKYDSMILL